MTLLRASRQWTPAGVPVVTVAASVTAAMVEGVLPVGSSAVHEPVLGLIVPRPPSTLPESFPETTSYADRATRTGRGSSNDAKPALGTDAMRARLTNKNAVASSDGGVLAVGAAPLSRCMGAGAVAFVFDDGRILIRDELGVSAVDQTGFEVETERVGKAEVGSETKRRPVVFYTAWPDTTGCPSRTNAGNQSVTMTTTPPHNRASEPPG